MLETMPEGEGASCVRSPRLLTNRRATRRLVVGAAQQQHQHQQQHSSIRPGHYQVSAIQLASICPHRLVVRTSRCGRDNPGSTPGEDIWVGSRASQLRAERPKENRNLCMRSRREKPNSLLSAPRRERQNDGLNRTTSKQEKNDTLRRIRHERGLLKTLQSSLAARET